MRIALTKSAPAAQNPSTALKGARETRKTAKAAGCIGGRGAAVEAARRHGEECFHRSGPEGASGARFLLQVFRGSLGKDPRVGG